MEMILDLAMTFWQWTVLGVLVIIGYVVNKFDKEEEDLIQFKYPDMPKMQPVPIATKDKGFFKGILMWLMGSRKWVICEDFHYSLNGVEYKVPKDFEFDGASVPKFLATFLSPVGVLLMGGLVHDYGYKYGTLLRRDGKNIGVKDQAFMDKLFRDICIEVNGFKFLNYLAYWALAIAGFVAWNGHKKRGTHIE